MRAHSQFSSPFTGLIIGLICALVADPSTAAESRNPIRLDCLPGFTLNRNQTSLLEARCERVAEIEPICPPGSTRQGLKCIKTSVTAISCPVDLLDIYGKTHLRPDGNGAICINFGADPICDLNFRPNWQSGKDTCIAIVAPTPLGNIRDNLRCPADRSLFVDYQGTIDKCVKYLTPIPAPSPRQR